MRKAIPLWEKDVPLGVAEGCSPPTLTPYLAGSKVRGAVIVCPGGGYIGRADYEGGPIAEAINRCGCHAFVLDYRVSPHRHPAPLLDAQRALRMVRHRADEWHINPSRVAIMGFSAGGHLCAMAATHYDFGNPQASDLVDRESCRPDAFISCYAVCSFASHVHAGSIKALTGKEQLTRAEAHYFSAAQNVTAATPPAFLWHTAEDEAVPVENTMQLAQALLTHNIPCELHIFPYGQHGIALGQNTPLANAWPDLLNAWLVAEGF